MSRFRREDWLDLGLRRLKAEGAPGLTLEALCAAAGKTKGSFYHHFPDLDAFAEAMVGFWVERDTLRPIAALQAEAEAEAAAGDRARELEAALEIDLALDVAVRQYARGRPAAQTAVRRADAARLELMTESWAERGRFTRLSARAVAELEYAAWLGSELAFPERDAAARRAMSRLFDALAEGPGDEDG